MDALVAEFEFGQTTPSLVRDALEIIAKHEGPTIHMLVGETEHNRLSIFH